MKVGIGEDGFWVLVLSLGREEEEVEVVGFRAHQPTSPAAIKIIDADRPTNPLIVLLTLLHLKIAFILKF